MARRLKKSIKRKLKKGCCISAIIVTGFAVTPSAVQANEIAPEVVSKAEYPVYRVQKGSSDSITNKILEEVMKGKNTVAIDESASNVNVFGLKSSQQGFQKVTISGTVSDAKQLVTNTFSQEAIVYVDNISKAPLLQLKKHEVTIDNDGAHTFVPESYIQRLSDSSGILPALIVEGNVDVNTDGIYPVKYTAVNQNGEKTVANMLVRVATPQWLIDQREAEARAQEEAEAQAKAEAEEQARKQRLEEEAKLLAEQATSSNLNYSGGGNPYGGGWSNCTYGAWQALYNATGIALPGMGDAGSWIYSASSMGYGTGTEPRAGTIAVYSHHVAYVDSVAGDMVHIVEGGFNGSYNERWVSKYGTGTQSLKGYIYVS